MPLISIGGKESRGTMVKTLHPVTKAIYTLIKDGSLVTASSTRRCSAFTRFSSAPSNCCS